MKKFIVAFLLFASIIQANYWQAKDWYNRYAYYIPNHLRSSFADYAFCRIDEIRAWLDLEKSGNTNIEYKIAREAHQRALNKKAELTNKLAYDYQAKQALEAMREEANRIAQDKFTSEILSSLFIQYKTGKRAAARMAKRDFYYECFELLNGYSWR